MLELPERWFDLELEALVDSYRPDTGSLQFVICAAIAAQQCDAVHTSLPGYLFATYEALLEAYRRFGYDVRAVRKTRRF